MPPTTKNTIAATPYMMPMLLVVDREHPRPPSGGGHRPAEHAERLGRGDDRRQPGGRVAGVAGTGRSMMAISVQP